MEHYFKDDETHFLIERLQNRKIRLELARLKTKNLELKDKYEEIFDNQDFLLEIQLHHQILNNMILHS